MKRKTITERLLSIAAAILSAVVIHVAGAEALCLRPFMWQGACGVFLKGRHLENGGIQLFKD
ncbi:MAG: hypothetical protein V8S96_01440 [Lachnospiraceae bacterium]